MIHIYYGDGKGKTTAAMGLALRAAGAKQKVVVGQFLKNGTSSEVEALSQLSCVTYVKPQEFYGFTYAMTKEQKEKAAIYYKKYLDEIQELGRREDTFLIVLDELLDVCNKDLLEEEAVRLFLTEMKEKEKEVVLTGRNPKEAFLKMADYVTQMQKEKHPYDRGIPARKGVEL
ncbi:MAG: cob(I)yrinic acid a,c-diamide adenosyltransferase [Lachnospiraceae bacterium]|nr:cob(I)yrinic acid a,c-diamide adenosyltransferase [Lachnospiraceae bacterium]